MSILISFIYVEMSKKLYVDQHTFAKMQNSCWHYNHGVWQFVSLMHLQIVLETQLDVNNNEYLIDLNIFLFIIWGLFSLAPTLRCVNKTTLEQQLFDDLNRYSIG